MQPSTRPGVVGLLVVSAACHGDVIHVDDDAPPGGDGASWTSAIAFLQDGLAGAKTGDEIRVAQGLYLADRSEADPDGTGDREASFHLVEGVALLGGYAGIGARNPDARDPEVFVTTLGSNPDARSYHVVTLNGRGRDTVLDGVRIQGGLADGPSEIQQRGGGMTITSGSPTISNCRFLDNSAVRGGGLYIGTDYVTVTGCTFVGNTAAAGGAIYNAGGGAGGVSLDGGYTRVLGSTFRANVADEGGAVYGAQWISSMHAMNSLFVANQADGGAAIHAKASSASGDLEVTNCTFVDNEGDHVIDASGGYLSVIIVRNTIIRGPATPFYNFRDVVFAYNCNIEGGFFTYYGVGTIDADPMFADPESDDYRLRRPSPSIDSGGTSELPAALPETDLDGNPRRVGDPCTPDTGAGDPPAIDMGAYEFQPVPGDVTCDDVVDVQDLVAVILGWGPCPDLQDPPEPCPGDANDDGVVDVDDLTLVILNWVQRR